MTGENCGIGVTRLRLDYAILRYSNIRYLLHAAEQINRLDCAAFT
jgi:hypothetical protein